MNVEGGRSTVCLPCAMAEAREVIRRRTAGIGWDVGVSVGVSPPGRVIGTVTGGHVRVRPRPSGYPPGRTLFSPSLVGELTPSSEGATDFRYRIAPGPGLGVRWLLAATAAFFWLLALVLWAEPPVLLAAFFTAMYVVFTFVYLITRSEKVAEDRALAGWIEDVVTGCRQAGTHGTSRADGHA
jgi:hypothetical protein